MEIKKKEFKKWLKAKHPTTVVGIRTYRDNPVSNWLVSTDTNLEVVIIMNSNFTIQSRKITNTYETPNWVIQFLLRLGPGKESLTAEQALKALKKEKK